MESSSSILMASETDAKQEADEVGTLFKLASSYSLCLTQNEKKANFGPTYENNSKPGHRQGTMSGGTGSMGTTSSFTTGSPLLSCEDFAKNRKKKQTKTCFSMFFESNLFRIRFAVPF